MLNNLESINLLEEFDLDKLYNVLKTPSPTKNLEIFSKIQNFSNSNDFFSNYTNKEIKVFSDFLKNLEDNYLSICNNENYLKFKSNTEKYISIISNFVLLINLIFKNKQIIRKILNNMKNNIIKYSSNNIIDLESNDKINEYLNKILNMSLTEEKTKNSFNSIINGNISPANLTNTSINSIIKDRNNSEENINFYELMKEDNAITPFFVSKGESINNNEISNNNNCNILICKKKDSDDSIFTLHCKNISYEKSNSKVKKIKIDKNKDVNKQEIFNNTNLNGKSNVIISDNIKCIKSYNINKLNMYKIHLKNINELYLLKKINSPEKIKLKQLIITNFNKTKNLYYSYCNKTVDKYIKDLKSLL